MVSLDIIWMAVIETKEPANRVAFWDLLGIRAQLVSLHQKAELVSELCYFFYFFFFFTMFDLDSNLNF
jgi:hypothetical protein